ncbi:GILT-like protein 3 [Venturia canescens]|uniref:GILT-like protein 3 n=1 Tax=Venturia canescens TaxID=32260 RepID=UPI001C9D5573|nr:GILT-like protein 3 [Venturia canescens]
MGLGNFKVRLFIAITIVLVVWQSALKFWSLPNNDSELSKEVNEAAKNGAIEPEIQKVLVTVYYEALCPDSRSFLIKQLEPTYQSLNEHITVEMVPYGKAITTKKDDSYEFSCQHGPAECEANMIHACAIDIIKNPSVRLEFLVCMIKDNLNPIDITKSCGEKMNLDVASILDCKENLKGKELLAMYGKQTDDLRPKISFIPTITLDKNSDNQREILKNLLKEVCRLYKVPPKGCEL